MTSDETLAHVMDATHSALCEHGYAALTVQDIADESDLSKSALHYHFDCKHDLLVAFLDYLFERFADRIADPAGENPPARLRSLVDTVVVPPEEGDADEFQTALLEIKAQAPYDDAFRERLDRFEAVFTEQVRSIVAEGVDDGTFRSDADPDEVASFVVTYAVGAQTRHVSVGEPYERSAAALRRYVDQTLVADADAAEEAPVR
jgi:AcrR family transcriptional regulator